MAIRDLPVKYVWVHRGGKTYAQRYHHNPANLEYRYSLAPIAEQYILGGVHDYWGESPPPDFPARIYPLPAMREPARVVRRILSGHGVEYWMFPTLLFRDERFLNAASGLPALKDFLAGVYTYGTPEEAYDAIYTVGQRVLRSPEIPYPDAGIWRAVCLDVQCLVDFNKFMGNRYASPIYRSSRIGTSESVDHGVYVKLDYRPAARRARDWLPLLTEITARQVARHIVRGYERSRDRWYAGSENEYARLIYSSHIANALCIPAVESRMRAVLESLNKPEIVDYYDKTVAPACRSHNGWRPDAGELYERLLSYGDS